MVPVAAPAVAPVVPVVPAAAIESVAPEEIVALLRTYFASALAAAPLAPAVVPVVPAAVEPAVPVVPVAVVPAAPAAVLALPDVFAAEFDGASFRHPVTVTVFSLLAVLGCVDVVCGAGVCAAITAVAHAASAAHKLVCIVFFIWPPATLPTATERPSPFVMSGSSATAIYTKVRLDAFARR